MKAKYQKLIKEVGESEKFQPHGRKTILVKQKAIFRLAWPSPKR
jgi:hypothetical protein